MKPLLSNGLITEVQEGEKPSFALFPNPAEDAVTLVLDELSPAEVEVLDALGRLVWATSTTGAATLLIPVEDLPTGSYVVRVHNGSMVSFCNVRGEALLIFCHTSVLLLYTGKK